MRYGRTLPVHLVCCVGATLDQIAGVEPWAPAWISRAGLEWSYRLLRHPLRFWRRYLIGLPLFVARVLAQQRRQRRARRAIGT